MREMRAFQRTAKNRYLSGLVHPDLAVKNGVPLKLYSDVPIPTSSVGWHEQYQFTTSANGTFMLSWSPNFFCEAGNLNINNQTGYSHMAYNNSAGLTGNATTAQSFFVPAGYTPNIAVQRYRCVSALLKVTYNGSVLNQSGTFLSCATFDPFPTALGTAVTAVSTFQNTLLDRFGTFSLISNGLWNNTQNVTETGHGLEALYVPIDPDDLVFERANYFYGSYSNGASTISPQSEGAHVNYVFAGRNLPGTTSCILVDVYYNYEVIADPSTAPLLRSSHDNVWTKDDQALISNTMSNALRDGNAIRPATNLSFKDVLADVARLGISYLPKLLGAL